MALLLGLRLDLAQKAWALRQARGRKARALRQVGASVASAVGADAEASAALAAAEAHRRALQVARDAVPASLESDRHAYAAVDGWQRTAVILRGLLDRLLLRARVRRLQAGLLPLHERLAALALEKRLLTPARTPLAIPPALAMEAAEASREHAALEAERAKLLEALDGRAWPGPLAVLGRELHTLGAFLVRELRGALVPSFSGLAGLGAGYLIAHTYTDSHLSALESRFGLREGGRHVVSSEAYQRLNFWAPIVAAALASYVSHRLQMLVRARYALSAGSEAQLATVQVAAVAPGETPTRPPHA